jgi:hypothetical protein
VTDAKKAKLLLAALQEIQLELELRDLTSPLSAIVKRIIRQALIETGESDG